MNPCMSQVGERMTASKKVFIEIGAWRRDHEGEEPEASEVVERTFAGQMLRGVFALAPGEKEGYHHVESYNDRAQRQDGVPGQHGGIGAESV